MRFDIPDATPDPEPTPGDPLDLELVRTIEQSVQRFRGQLPSYIPATQYVNDYRAEVTRVVAATRDQVRTATLAEVKAKFEAQLAAGAEQSPHA